MSSTNRRAAPARLKSVPATPATSLIDLFEDAQAPFLAAAGLVDGAIRNGFGTKIEDRLGQLLLPMNRLCQQTIEQLEELQKALKDCAAADHAEELRGKAALGVLATLQIAAYGDEDGDDGDSGFLIYPIKLLLQASARRFDVLESALLEAPK